MSGHIDVAEKKSSPGFTDVFFFLVFRVSGQKKAGIAISNPDGKRIVVIAVGNDRRRPQYGKGSLPQGKGISYGWMDGSNPLLLHGVFVGFKNGAGGFIIGSQYLTDGKPA